MIFQGVIYAISRIEFVKSIKQGQTDISRKDEIRLERFLTIKGTSVPALAKIIKEKEPGWSVDYYTYENITNCKWKSMFDHKGGVKGPSYGLRIKLDNDRYVGFRYSDYYLIDCVIHSKKSNKKKVVNFDRVVTK